MSRNTWPGGNRYAMTQVQHEEWNHNNYPGTRQLCIDCDNPTGRCEEDSIFIDEHGPLCEECSQYGEE